MSKRKAVVNYAVLELDGVRYAVVRETRLRSICRDSGLESQSLGGTPAAQGGLAGFEADDDTLAQRLVARRKRAGISQAELARRAGIRVETLNRVERGRTTPDFATVRKLVIAMTQAETALDIT